MGQFDRFARFYDRDYRHYDDDVETIIELACAEAGPILELGCGTGRLLLPLARAGCLVTGVDVSRALLDLAAAKLADAGLTTGVRLLQEDMRTATLEPDHFAFAFCTSNTLMHLGDPDAQSAALENIGRHLRPGGLLLLDLFNPDVARLVDVSGLQELADRWHDAETGADVLKWCVRSVDWAAQLQETLFIYEEIFSDGRTARTVCPFTLRFLWRNEAELMLEKAGFVLDDLWGDFDGSPYGAQSEHMILLARRPHTL